MFSEVTFINTGFAHINTILEGICTAAIAIISINISGTHYTTASVFLSMCTVRSGLEIITPRTK